MLTDQNRTFAAYTPPSSLTPCASTQGAQTPATASAHRPFSLNEYEHVRLGYAVTTHRAQGITVDNAYVLAGGSMQDRELSYVQMSRARDNTRIYIDKLEAGENLKEMVLTMERSRAKELALDVQRRGGRERKLEGNLHLSHGPG
jgi:ATP-dependent exoDNAse (exonuclease V) alpha subunit